MRDVTSMLSNTLPELKEERSKREQNVTPKILKWFRENYHFSCAIEIKSAQKASPNTIPKSALEDHQRRALLCAKKEGLVHKIADAKRRNPFDAFQLVGSQAFVVAAFPKHGVALVFDVEKWTGARYSDSALFRIKL